MRAFRGMGEITALTMLIETPERGPTEKKCVASLAGRAPPQNPAGGKARRRA
ncbi:MAG: transposase [Methylocella sp.]